MSDSGMRPPLHPLGPWRTLAIGLGAALLGGAVIELAKGPNLSGSDMLRDPAAIYDFPVLAGVVSVMGVGLVLVTAAVLIFASSLRVPQRGLMAAAGAFSVILALDDQFLLHERVLPKMLGVPELVVVSVYALIGLGILIAAYGQLGRQVLIGILPALVLLGGSLVADLWPWGRASYSTEDLLKLGGYGAWAGFWISIARSRCRTALGF